jgi:Tripartite tricarboxylate transporter family receptor
MKLPRRNFLHLAAAAAALPAVSRTAWAQPYPSRPVRLVVGAPAGGGFNIVARLMGQWLSGRLGQQFVIDNRPGGGGNIGTEAVVRAPADGYTLLLVTAANAINTTLYEKLSFNLSRDIAPVAGITRVPNVTVVNPSVPSKTVPEFIAYAKANPGKLNMASGGNGTTGHLSGAVQGDDRRRHGSCAISGHSSRAHRSARRAGPGHVRHHALVDRIHQGRQAAPAGGNHHDAFGRITRSVHRERFRTRLRGKHLVRSRRAVRHNR